MIQNSMSLTYFSGTTLATRVAAVSVHAPSGSVNSGSSVPTERLVAHPTHKSFPGSQALAPGNIHRCRANIVHIRHSRPDSGLGFQVEFRETFQVVASSLGSENPSTLIVNLSTRRDALECVEQVRPGRCARLLFHQGLARPCRRAGP